MNFAVVPSAITVGNVERITVDLLPAALSNKQDLLSAAAEITVVADEFTQACAVDCVREINALLKAVEKSRTEVKAPVLEVGRKIDSLAKTFSGELSVESARISGLITSYQVAERKKAEEAERVRQAELLRVAQQQREAALAEEKRLEALRAAELAKETAFSRKEAEEAEAMRKQIEAANATLQERKAALEAEQAKLQATVAKPVDKPAGLVVKDVWKFEVLNIWDLAKDNRDLVRIEPNASAINEKIRNGMRSCPGLRIYSETISGVRQ